MAWEIILEIAAEALASSMGKRIGENLGQKFTDVLVGNGGASDFEEQVLPVVNRIEEKVDAIAAFLHDELPEIVYNQSTAALMHQYIIQASNKTDTIKGELGTFYANRSKENESRLRQAANDLAEVGLQLAKNGPGYESSAISAFAGVMSAFSVLAKKASTAHLAGLKAYADDYLTVVEPWLDPSNSAGIVSVLQKKQSELEIAQRVVSWLPGTKFLLAVSGPWPASGLPDPPQDKYLFMPAWFIRSGNSWTSDFGEGQEELEYYPHGAPITNWHFSVQTWAMPIATASFDKELYNTHLVQVTQVVNQCQERAIGWPNQISELNTEDAEVTDFVKTLKGLRTLTGQVFN
jgi:hypothetical protein